MFSLPFEDILKLVREGDTLPPGSLVWALCEGSPFWPAVVIDASEAVCASWNLEPTTRKQILELMDAHKAGDKRGVIVRYFGEGTYGILAGGMAHPFVSGTKSNYSYVWHASKIEARKRGWSADACSPSVKPVWNAAIEDARSYQISKKPRASPAYLSTTPRDAVEMREHTPVWAVVCGKPLWPAIVVSVKTVTKSRGSAVKVKYHIHGFVINANLEVLPNEIFHYIPGIEWRKWILERSERERTDRGWSKFSRSLIEEWYEACDVADRILFK